MLQKFPMYAYIPVANLARARQFYEQKLGFKPAREVAGGAKTAWFKDTEGNILAVVQAP
jgi:predicted enzyme related to lactoylglutathione lyase